MNKCLYHFSVSGFVSSVIFFLSSSSCFLFDAYFRFVLVNYVYNMDYIDIDRKKQLHNLHERLVFPERTFEDHENLVEPLSAWTRDSENKVLFLERGEKYEVFKNPQVCSPTLQPRGVNTEPIVSSKDEPSLSARTILL